jgi:GNAT superfamily N-acetyltransferase
MTITIRELRPEDISEVAAAFAKLGWDKPISQYEGYLTEQEIGTRTLLFAFDASSTSQFIGYITVVWESHYPSFRAQNIPEIVDFNVLPNFRQHGIGTQLMDAAEACIARRKITTVGIGVGMTPDYGAAQRLYVKRGYVPDGTGLYNDNGQVSHGKSVIVDDSLVLYFTKSLAIARP